MDLSDCVWKLLDQNRLQALRSVQRNDVEELRFRLGQPVVAINSSGGAPLSGDVVTPQELDNMLERAVQASFYAHKEELRNGFLHVGSGVRIGICGHLYYRDQMPDGMCSVTSLSIRIPHVIPSCADEVYPKLIRNGIRNTLIVSPPGSGKTTLLRALIRRLSSDGCRVAVADERGELSAFFDRQFAFDLGPNTDVITGGRKAETASILLRAMNPQILAFDEITAAADLEMIRNAAGCGVVLLATAHGTDPRSMRKRPVYRELFSLGIFETIVQVQLQGGTRCYHVESI